MASFKVFRKRPPEIVHVFLNIVQSSRKRSPEIVHVFLNIVQSSKVHVTHVMPFILTFFQKTSKMFSKISNGPPLSSLLNPTGGYFSRPTEIVMVLKTFIKFFILTFTEETVFEVKLGLIL